ncbi:putative SNF2 family helicase/ATPase [Aspergillus luchuensis]|nr:uncharacterized protein AKAW2_70870A [Aspergillus luchuensis]BCS03992.1 hypothetical protein AKAW2_70870A [Aspergillus luchuensis]BCS15598.1 hypothetical protein ALUC_70831A [Aspergillus luchuensis]GAA89830.1 SNF2 family helicase/ATPase [Aspergillus luchuensis IFO 4308]
MEPGGDPLDWTVDEVVQFLCRNPQTPWSRSLSRAPRPDPVTFEATLRENEITGEVLLHDVDKETLREDLGVRALGHRSSILMAIRYLQRKSLKFQESRNLGSLSEDHVDYASPVVPRLDTSVYRLPPSQNVTPQREPYQSARLQTPSSKVPPQEPSGDLPKADLERRADPVEHRNPTEAASRPATVQRTEENTPSTPEQPPGRRIRPGEDLIVDAHGKKRRKLNLSALAQDESDHNVPKQTSRPISSKEWYMGPEEMNVSGLFYASDSDYDPEESGRTFSMVGSRLPTGQRRFVNRRLLYFLKQRPVKLSSTQSALVPYRDLTKQKSKPSKKEVVIGSSIPRACTLYTVDNSRVTVTKDELQKWPQLVQSEKADNGGAKDHDPFAYLLQKYPAQGDDGGDLDTLPLYGDSGSEGEFDDDTWQEIEDERQEPLPRQTALTSAEIKAIIASCISEYENKWLQDGKKKEEPKARRIWLSSRRGKTTNKQIKTFTRDINLLERRLRVFTKAIEEGEYASRKELQVQCRSLENTVINIQKQKWLISVLELEKCPPKMAFPARPLPPKRRSIDEDEESLGSETDNGPFDDDSLEDFIEDDDSVVDRVEDDVFRQSLTPSSDDDDIISPSGRRRKLRARAHPFVVSSSPSPPPIPEGPIETIDLTGDDPLSEEDDFTVETPPLNPARQTPQSERVLSRDISPAPKLPPKVYVEIPSVEIPKTEVPSPSEQDGTAQSANSARPQIDKVVDLPEINDFDKLKGIAWRLLEERHDRCRLLAKLIASLADEERQRLTRIVPTYDVERLQHLTNHALNRLSKGKDTLPHSKPDEATFVLRMASLFISWMNCAHYLVKGFPKAHVLEAKARITDFPGFYKELSCRLDAYQTWDLSRQQTAMAAFDSPHKKRKREVKESQAAKMNQENAKLRVAVQERLRQKLERKLESMGVSNTDATRQAVSFGDPVIYLDPHIGQRVKPHQLHGIQFMWRELTEDGGKHQGCLLAHTMGLGKTMQVISLLVTIANAAVSENPWIRKQIPDDLLRSQTLILCPSSLIENWYEEFIMWTPKDSAIGPVNKITSSASLSERLDTVASWNEEGGVLLISYDIFRTWIHNKETSKRGQPLTEEQHENIKKWLLEGANIIVADEAHKMKNPVSGITLAAMQFRSQSRIALTGSPLANNLVDYFTMVNWIAKGYLGEFTEFKANFVEPIEEGLYVDSTHSERRRSLVKLQVLNKILEPKINRADISVLEGSMPPKVEFVITVPLTAVQKSAYDLYVQSVLEGSEDVSRMKLLSWLAVLGLCCNHPACFRDKLLSRASEAQKLDKVLDGAAIEPAPGDEPITQLGLDVETLVSKQEQLFSTVPDMGAATLSCRAEILNRIIAESVRAGDKVLVFSHSIPTLNYVENDILKASNWKYCRLDGSTPIANRQHATKLFNQGSAEDVYLISTRAGGLGLNIFGANRVIIFDFTFNPVWEEQAVGRAYRLGQKKPVFVYRFIAGGTFEEVMYNKAVFKTQLAFRVVDKKNPIRLATRSLGEYLFPAKQTPQQDVTECLGKDPEVLDRIIRADAQSDENQRLIRKIKLTELFQKDDNDKLTEDEKNAAQQQLDDERLKRTNYEAYQKMIIERQRIVLAQGSAPYGLPPQVHFSPLPSQRPPQPFTPQPSAPALQPTIPASAHNVGPPALAPDTSITQQAPQTPVAIPGLTMTNSDQSHAHPHPLSTPVTPGNRTHSNTSATATSARPTYGGSGGSTTENSSAIRDHSEPPQDLQDQNKPSCRPQ